MCIMSKSLVHAVGDFAINHNLSLPSDHAPIGVSIDVSSLHYLTTDNLLQRASSLGDHAVLHTCMNSSQRITKRPVHFSDIDYELLTANLLASEPPTPQNNVNETVSAMADTLYQCARKSKVHRNPPHQDLATSRWQRILDSNDHKALWRAISWSGIISRNPIDTPSDEQFQVHLEELSNPDRQTEVAFSDVTTDVTIPLLDGPINPDEVESVLRHNIKPNKGCGPDGIPPVVISALPATWIIVLTSIFNLVFHSGYPMAWTYARLTMLFKKGRTNLCDNYRGISLINSLAKVYDYILYKRLTLWFVPSREQAGAQAQRGCLEHIISLRILMDYCVKKRQKLYVTYIDFSKAYDRVPRDELMRTLRYLGCGAVMLSALMSMYKVSYSVLGVAIITTIMGVRQGSPTSCFLFTCYVDSLITLIKDRCGVDGFLEWLHVLMLMDDTVVLATTREQCVKKLCCVLEFCKKSGMVINQSKTKFMVINSESSDRKELEISYDELTCHMSWCDSYVYLGSIFTSEGKIVTALKDMHKIKISISIPSEGVSSQHTHGELT